MSERKARLLAKRQLADEYDAAQKRGEVGQSGTRTDLVPKENEVRPATVTDLGLTRKQVHEGRLRDAGMALPIKSSNRTESVEDADSVTTYLHVVTRIRSMAVYFDSSDPDGLLKAFDAAIAQKEAKGKINTWKKHSDGRHYTHTSDNWGSKAFFKASVVSGRLIFNIVHPKDNSVGIVTYGYYHGHLIETFLNHFDTKFSIAQATPLPVTGDKLQ